MIYSRVYKLKMIVRIKSIEIILTYKYLQIALLRPANRNTWRKSNYGTNYNDDDSAKR